MEQLSPVWYADESGKSVVEDKEESHTFGTAPITTHAQILCEMDLRLIRALRIFYQGVDRQIEFCV